MIASFGIECQPISNRLPDPEKDSVILICTTFHEFKDNKYVCVHQSIIKSQDFDEKTMIVEWIKLILKMKTTLIVGFGIFSFDYDFLQKRAIKLGIDKLFDEIGLIREVKKYIIEGNINKIDLNRHPHVYGPLLRTLEGYGIEIPKLENNLDAYTLDCCLATFKLYEKLIKNKN